MKKLCIYHGNCADGFGAAFAVRHALGEENVDFYPGVHQDDPPDVSGRSVIMVDFSYKRPVLLAMAEKAKTILIIDHHASAEKDLVDLPANVNAYFDMHRSGAVMAWQYFNPDLPIPRLFEHIQDRDLWRFDLPGTRAIQAALFSYPYDFDVWNGLLESFDEFGGSRLMFVEGEAIERKHFKDIREFIAAAAYRADIAGYNVPVLNAPYFWSSDAGHIMSENEPFAACYWDTPKGRVYSLRSAENGVDVSEVAVKFGGGGHKHAAGYRVDFEGERNA